MIIFAIICAVISLFALIIASVNPANIKLLGSISLAFLILAVSIGVYDITPAKKEVVQENLSPIVNCIEPVSEIDAVWI